MTILQIHGFNSGPGSKAEELQKAFPQAKVIAPQLKHQPKEDVEFLKSILAENKGQTVHVVGTSLGGFYTMLLSTAFSNEEGFHFYVINPSFSPDETLSRYIGETVTNLKNQEKTTITKEFINELKLLKQELLNVYDKEAINATTFFIGTRDELLDFTELKEFIASFRCPYAFIESDQDHRFGNLEPVIQRIIFIMRHRYHFPIQNLLNIFASKSSVVISPVIVPK
jgi:uncharacterized protein